MGKSENFVPNIEETTNVSVFVDWNYLSVKAEKLKVELDGNNGFQLRVRVDCKESETKNITFEWYKSSTNSKGSLPSGATSLEENSQSLESDYYENYYDGNYSDSDPEKYYYCLVTRKYDYVGISGVEKVVGPFQIDNGQSGGQQGDDPSGEPSVPTTTPTAKFITIEMKGENNQLIRTLSVSNHEVTQKEYETYCAYSTKEPSDLYGKGDNYPAYNITWYDAIVYCNLRSMAEKLTPVYTINGSTDPKSTEWGANSKEVGGVTKYYGKTFNNDDWNKVTMNQNADGYRLPTEQEWEYLARGGQDYTYAGSNNIEEVAWYDNNSQKTSHQIMTKTANGYELYDMSGNVYEWIWDLNDEFSGTKRKQKGGSWCDNAKSCEIKDNNWAQPIFAVQGDEQNNYGFRIVRTIPEL